MIRPFGERALLVEVTGWEAAQALVRSLGDVPVAGVTGAVPGLASVLVELDADADVAAIEREIDARVRASAGVRVPAGRIRTIPVAYGGVHGPDLERVAAACDLAPEAWVERHAATELRVVLCGFAPGFAYLGDLPEPLRVPRLATPRAHTPPGSVAVAGAMTGIYPADLPGGWRIVGRTPLTLFDPRREPPAYLAPGDVVRWRPMDADAPMDASVADDW